MIKELKKLFYLLNKKEKSNLLWLFLLMLIASLLEIIGLGAIPAFISIITNSSNLPSYIPFRNFLLTLSQTELFLWVSASLLAVYIVKNGFSSFMLYFKSNLTTNIQIRIGYSLLYKYFSAPYTFHLKRNSIDLFSKIVDEARLIISNILVPVLNLSMDILFSVSIIIFLLVYDPFTSITIFICLSTTGYLFLLFTKNKTVQIGKNLPYMRMHLNKSITEGLNGLKDSRILNRELLFLNRANNLMEDTHHATKYIQFISTLTRPFIETIAIFAMVLICIIQVSQGYKIDSILPTLTLFAIASIRLLPTVNTLVSGYAGIRNALYIIDPVYKDFEELTNTGISIEDDHISSHPLTFEKEIIIKNVDYTYPGSEKKSLQDIHLTIHKGEAIGLIGSSGAGKTTLVDIILGLLTPENGSIIIDSTDIKDHTRSWQKNIGYIPQYIYLSDSSIKRNIAFGINDHEIDDQKLWNAIHAAQLELLITELPEGVDTEIGERGVRLSGGQRQRIGIARALYHNPQVLIMDEATSALDNITEKYVVEAIERLKGDRTIITIAHRLTTVKNCDCLYLMKQGKIVAKGTYDELLNHNSEFQEMAI
jgi:ABC-type multidrug transport system fused ATPase/permease subunit